MADLFKPRKTPQIRKIPALLGLDRLHCAIVAFQKNTAAIRLFDQGQPLSIGSQPGELLDEVVFADLFMPRHPGDFQSSQADLPRPATAGRAALAFIENWHRASITTRRARCEIIFRAAGVQTSFQLLPRSERIAGQKFRRAHPPPSFALQHQNPQRFRAAAHHYAVLV